MRPLSAPLPLLLRRAPAVGEVTENERTFQAKDYRARLIKAVERDRRLVAALGVSVAAGLNPGADLEAVKGRVQKTEEEAEDLAGM